MDKITFEYWKALAQESVLGISFVLVILGLFSWSIYNANDDIEATEELTGHLIGIHQIQTNEGSKDSVFVIQLSSGKNVNILPPPNVPFRKGKTIKILKIKKASGNVYYEYNSYVD